MTDQETAGGGSSLAETRAARRVRQYDRAVAAAEASILLANFHADSAVRALSLAARVARLAASEGTEVGRDGSEPATEQQGDSLAGLATYAGGRRGTDGASLQVSS